MKDVADRTQDVADRVPAEGYSRLGAECLIRERLVSQEGLDVSKDGGRR